MEKWEEHIQRIDVPVGQDYISYIWGAGNTAILAHQGMIRENLYKRFHVTAYIDQKLAGTSLNGIPVLHPDILSTVNKKNTFVLICTQNQWMLREIQTVLEGENLRHCTLDEAIVWHQQENIRKSAELMDQQSKEIYHRLIVKRLLLDTNYEELYAGESYFGIHQFCHPRPNDVFLDCGAYCGDSAERYIWRMNQFNKIIAVEPDFQNFVAMCSRFSRLRKEWGIPDDRLVAVNGGLDRNTTSLFLKSQFDGLSSYTVEENDVESKEIMVWSIDDLTDKLGIRNQVTYIKADVESFEYRVLEGARKTITECKPRLAICIYHNAVDMYSIPLLLNSLNPDYHFSVRHHSFGYEESVLYAY